MKKTVLVIFGILFCFDLAFGQGFYNNSRNRNFLVTLATGTTHYYGDLAAPNDHSNIQPNFSVGARYNVYRWISVGADLTWFMLSGDDKTDPVKEVRNLSFQSHNIEFSAIVQGSVFEEGGRFYTRPFANPYGFIGIGLLSYNPTAKLPNDDTRYNLRKLNTSGEEYSGLTVAFPAGLGVKFRVNPFINVAIEGGYRFLISDHLDDVSSGIYPDPTSFSDETARLLSDRTWETLPEGEPTWAEQGKNVRGNPNNMDGYLLMNIRFEYYLAEIGSSGSTRRKLKGGGNRKNKPPKRRTNRNINRIRY